MSAIGTPPTEPSQAEFFASAEGVCVYVNIRGRAFRVQFESPDGPVPARGTTEHGADEAVELARRAFAKHRADLTLLFLLVERERAERKR